MSGALAVDLIERLSDKELPDALWEHVRSSLEEHGPGDNRLNRAAVLGLPRGLRITFTLMHLDSELRNGGFYQYFTNLSGQFVRETLEDLRLIGAPDHADLLERAIAVNRRIESRYTFYRDRWVSPEPYLDRQAQEEFWSEIRKVFLPEFEPLESAFYQLEESGSLWQHFVRYVRAHTDECLVVSERNSGASGTEVRRS